MSSSPAPLLFVGTSGYSYPEWRGAFYPEDLSTKKMLGFYAERFASTELNHTFYKMPSLAQLEASRALVPESFRFSLKVPASITHRKDPAPGLELLQLFGERVRGLQHKIGCLYFQLPPTLERDLARLRGLLELRIAPAAFELPHASWHVPAVRELLGAHDAAFVIVDDDPIQAPRWFTASRSYVRLRRARYDRATLDHWVEQLRAAGSSEAYVYFRHEDGANGPRFATRFLQSWSRASAPAAARAKRKKPGA